MSYSPVDSKGNFLDTSLLLPDEGKQVKIVLRDTHFTVTTAINNREISQYPLQEILCGNSYYTSGKPQKFRDVFRKVFKIDGIAPGTTKTIPHGISGITEATNIKGDAKSSTRFFPLPYPAVNPTDTIEMYITPSDIVIISGATAQSITTGSIVLEYIK